MHAPEERLELVVSGAIGALDMWFEPHPVVDNLLSSQRIPESPSCVGFT
jgi:hypothetical protein